MPPVVNPEKCDGCKALAVPACNYICPNDLMYLDKTTGKSYNIEPDMCWECFSCAKMCPQGAIEIRHYSDVGPLGGRLIPMRGTDSIMWTVIYRSGKVLRFKMVIRTTPWGSIKAPQEYPEPDPNKLKEPVLSHEPEKLGVPEVPKLKK
ncbi:MAG: adenylyl-sulfate reductase subunit beta [Crenarchaeota archaeon]|nr:adenylyl-sulfate reductase subunit beta [Thermoproteota archaeon]